MMGTFQANSNYVNMTNHEGYRVSTSLAQSYLKHILRIATSSSDEYAFTAVEVIGSILRQGLVHPKEVIKV